MEGGLPPVQANAASRERRSSLQGAITIKQDVDKGSAAPSASPAAASASRDLESLQALLEDRRLRPSNVPVPLKDDPVYGRFIKRKGLTSKAELILEMRDAKLETSVLAAKKPTDSSYYGLPEDFDVLEARTNDGLTPLHKAAQMGQLQSVELLTAEKAEANALDKNGKSPLDYAEMGDHKQIADYLIKQGGLRGIAVRKKQKQAEQKAAATPRDATPTAA